MSWLGVLARQSASLDSSLRVGALQPMMRWQASSRRDLRRGAGAWWRLKSMASMLGQRRPALIHWKVLLLEPAPCFNGMLLCCAQVTASYTCVQPCTAWLYMARHAASTGCAMPA